MMRRIAVIGSVLLASSVIAAMGLAQNGIRPARKSETSLVDRLSALRESVNSSDTEASEDVRTSSNEAAEPATLDPSQGQFEQDYRSSRATPRTAVAEPQAADPPRRPRLLSQLDPLNLLSFGGAEADESSQQQAQARRSAAAGSREMVRRRESTDNGGSPPEAVSASSGMRPHRPRRSPLIRASEEAPSQATSAIDATRGSALGPGSSASVKLPSLDRPMGDSLPIAVAEDNSGDREPEPTAVPLERQIQESSRDSASATPATDSEGPEAADDAAAQAASVAESEEKNLAEEPAEASPEVSREEDARTEQQRVAARYRSARDDASAVDAHTDNRSELSDESDHADASASEQVLSSHVAPSVAWQVAGPKQIVIGREATFDIQLRNEGDQAVERLVGRIKVPASAEILSAEASHGVGQRVEGESDESILEWRVDRLSAGREAMLRLAVVPRSSHSMNLEVSVRSEPRAALARVEVLEPKLQLTLEGPSDVLHGEPRSYRITVYNPGTGPAENVNVLFTPPGEGEAAGQNHAVGLLKPGERKTIELEVAPQVAGNVAVSALATAEGDLRDQAERRILVRKPELMVDVRGPRTTYAGTVATYYFRIRNAGDATASEVVMQAHLPLGSEFVRASDDRRTEPKTEEDSVTWDIGALPPGEELFMELKCIVNWAGDNTLEVTAEGADGKLQHSKPITTHVVALADLKLEVSDPKGPVAVGKEALYEVRIRNRGSNTAEAVNVVALFSEGVDPIGVEGGQHAIENGRVAFRTIESLPAGREIAFKIRAVASEPGTHVFRAEVLCRELETKLAAEETTRYFLDESATVRGNGSLQAASRADLFQPHK